jgi:hypothetical protein
MATATALAPTPAGTAMVRGGLTLGTTHKEKKNQRKAEEQAQRQQQKRHQEWTRAGAQLAKQSNESHWAIADWLLTGAEIIPSKKKRYDEAEKITGMERATLQDMASVASRISVRNENLTFFHHRLVAKMKPAAQKKWLDYAEQRKLSVNSLRLELAKQEDKKPAVPADKGKARGRAVEVLFTRDQRVELAAYAKKQKKTIAQLVVEIVLKAVRSAGR